MLEITEKAKEKLKEYLESQNATSPVRIMATVGG